MKKYSCPSCGAEVAFQSSASVFSVCKFCRSTLIRKDMDIEAIGKMADLKEDGSPLQLGTLGRFKGDFSLIGRVRVSWEDGFWNEWFVRFDDGREGWLADAQGLYMISFPVEVPPGMPTATEIRPGLPIQVGKICYSVDDVKDVTYTFAEGELPFAAPPGFKAVSIDLCHGESDFASLSYGTSGEVGVFIGQYVEFEQFHFQNLRPIDGW
jgi:hypothetical protein